MFSNGGYALSRQDVEEADRKFDCPMRNLLGY